VAAQILGLGAFDSTNSAQIIGTGPGISAVMGGASVTPAPPKFNLKFLGLRCSTNSGTWCIRQQNFSTNYWTKSGNLCCYGWCWRHGRSVNSFVRYPLTNFFAQTDTHTHVKLKTSLLGVESGNVLSSTSNFRRYSNTSIRSTNMEVTNK